MQSQQFFAILTQNTNGFCIVIRRYDCALFLFCQNFYECVFVNFNIAKLLHFLFTLSLVF